MSCVVLLAACVLCGLLLSPWDATDGHRPRPRPPPQPRVRPPRPAPRPRGRPGMPRPPGACRPHVNASEARKERCACVIIYERRCAVPHYVMHTTIITQVPRAKSTQETRMSIGPRPHRAPCGSCGAVARACRLPGTASRRSEIASHIILRSRRYPRRSRRAP